MKTNQRMRRGFTLVELLVVIAIIATLAGISVPVIMAQQKKGALTEAISNAKEIGLSMFNFDQDYGGFPSETTGTQVDTANPNSGMTFSGGNSNCYFRQLIAGGYADNERMFYAKAAYTHKPDNNMTGSFCLAAGEVGFAYIMVSQTAALPDSGNSGRPLILASVYQGMGDGTFDPDVYGRKAVIYRLDNSCIAESIRPSDKNVVVSGGLTLLSTGANTVWGTDTIPIIIPPLKAQ